MKLKSYWIEPSELDDYLKKYQEKIKFVSICTTYVTGFHPNTILMIIDEDESVIAKKPEGKNE